MKLKIILMDGTVLEKICESFEFRTNRMTNWIRLKNDKDVEMIYNVATIKSIKNVPRYTYWDEELYSYLLKKKYTNLNERDVINILGMIEHTPSIYLN